jgi:hypothetical protein
MSEQIRTLAQLLGINPGALAALAREISCDVGLRDLEYMREADAVELLAFLEAMAEAVIGVSAK